MAGGIKKITDPWGASVTYELNRAGETTGITGVGYADINQWTNRAVSQFVSNAQYRAWGALKSFTNGNFAIENANFSMGFNSRLQLTRFVAGDIIWGFNGSDHNYHADGRIKDVLNNPGNNNIDRHYNYDHVGRLTNATTGNSQPQTTPYHLAYEYDVWGNTTARNGWYWSEQLTAPTQTYNNNRNTAWTYDVAGNVIDASGELKLDAAGRQASFIDGVWFIGYLNEHGYDGDGQHIRYSSTLIDSNPVASNRFYQVRSSVLGGVVLAEIRRSNLFEPPNESTKSFVYFNGQQIAYQSVDNFPEAVRHVIWVYRHPLIGSLIEHNRLNVNGQPQDGIYAHTLTDPTGAKIETIDPGSIPPPEEPYLGPWKAGHGFGLGFGGGTGDCYVDGLRTDCTQAIKMVNDGSGRVQSIDRWFGLTPGVGPAGVIPHWGVTDWMPGQNGDVGTNIIGLGFAFGFQPLQQSGDKKDSSSGTCAITVIARPVYYPDKIRVTLPPQRAGLPPLPLEIPIPRSLVVNNTPGFHTFIVVKHSSGNQVRTYTAGPNGSEGRARDELYVWGEDGEPDPDSENGIGMNDARTKMSPFWFKGTCDGVIKSFDETMRNINDSHIPYVLTGGWADANGNIDFHFDGEKSNTCNTFTWCALENYCPTIREDIETKLFEKLRVVNGEVPGWGHRPRN